MRAIKFVLDDGTEWDIEKIAILAEDAVAIDRRDLGYPVDEPFVSDIYEEECALLGFIVDAWNRYQVAMALDSIRNEAEEDFG